MKKIELLKLIESLEDEADVLDTLKEQEEIKGLIKPFDVEKITLEDFKKVITDNKEIKGYYTSEKDRAVSKGIETFKSNNLQKLIDEELKKKSNEGLSEEAIQLKELQAKFEALEKKKTISELKGKYTKFLAEKGLNAELVDFVFNEDEEIFNSNVERINNILQNSINLKTNEILNNNEYIPPTSGGGSINTAEEQLKKVLGIK
ncbi:DUF4355 domain-containing protein [uncultured Clostridium sp.]|jgi:hypothetical protein|uniref:DUF4355 domain-containing protein n=1 Tax=uncultured Clostridium sp. TaxID=59620 RepID=UPI00205B4661|nr:DUF4355 domain-containing protein [uncultured Clostridium sp.]DAV65715.1 MAG TPA: Major head protein [Caudoviricetes sp.]